MESDALFLSRLQFAFTVSFHIVLPSFTIGLASYLAVLEGLWLWRRDEVYLRLFKYWLKIFALSFGMGVVSGIVLSYQFGTNWGPFSDMVGPVLGPLMGYEVLSAFFLEAGFLGVMLFGLNRVGKRLHFSATLMVAVGTLFSAFWILSANSWMHTPAGYGFENDQFVPKDWWSIIFNPSFPYRLVHMVLAAYLTTAFVVGGVGAYHLLKDRGNAAAQVMFSMAMWMAALVAPLQILAGDLHGLNTLEHQPAKVAAMEGHWQTRRGAPLVLFAIPDMQAEENHLELAIPKLGSMILTHAWDGEVQGLKAWPPDERPNATLIFWTFRVMVAIGVLMVLVGLASLWLRFRRALYERPWFLRAVLLFSPAGFVAVLAGWITTEVGRQPWLVYGLLRISNGVSPVDTPVVAVSLLGFVVVYCLVFGAGIYYLLKLMQRLPAVVEEGLASGEITRAAGITPLASLTPDSGGKSR
ncbi:MAG: cytochrome ubiquinol oxidase subunit I [Gammaproteobacteria bacterium]|nr:cytochrome ubiquinol oxidase subunit I [Gammaproteobacteria bacterium]